MTDPRFEDPDYILRTRRIPHEGMPPMETDGPSVSSFEFWPGWKFYTPLSFYMAWLSLRYGGMTLPSVVNPFFDNGGVVGESKLKILDLIAGGESARYVAPFFGIKKEGAVLDVALQNMAKRNIPFPVVAKPDNGCRGMGVQPIYNREGLDQYIKDFPQGEVFILQELVNFEGEAGVFYVRQPDEERGKIISLTLKYFPYVTGDGKSTLKELIERDERAGLLQHIYLPRHRHRWDLILPEGQSFRIAFTGSHSRGTIFRNGNRYITPEMEAQFDAITRHIPEFYFGRIDVRFRDMGDLESGENLKIMEINGATGEATHVWDSKYKLWEAYRDLAEQYRLLYEIGAKNKKRGFQPDSLFELLKQFAAYKKLSKIYPMTQ